MENLGFLVGHSISTAARWEITGVRGKSRLLKKSEGSTGQDSASDSSSTSGDADPRVEAALAYKALKERELGILRSYLVRTW